MRLSKSFVVLLAMLTLATVAMAARPTNTTICNYYTNATFGNDNHTNQYLLLKILVNTVVIGNYTATPTGISVPGILQEATLLNETVNLAPYFTGALNTTNVNEVPSQVNFLDGGGATPLTYNNPSNDSTTCASNQCQLLTHLYEVFGSLLGCSAYGTKVFPSYTGDVSMYRTHKFMALKNAEVSYFIGQVGLAAQAFGVESADVVLVGSSLTTIFAQQCSPAVPLVPSLPAEAQNICLESDCPVSTTPNCTAYGLTSANTTGSSVTASPNPPGVTSSTSPPPPGTSSATAAISALARAGGVGAGFIVAAFVAGLAF
eukprot:TRINITY_DN32552_c0_g1_i1.p1 TRINITY_DN32552_c0_g1~~TRINITY_DN32552_c0_g1_i1.p1  ORF type:complete len:317 (+),score=10.93 TRINITY_DN32552_c0_g1_i1:139-1089(+)